MRLDTKWEMIAYVQGYVLALDDIQKDVEGLGIGGQFIVEILAAINKSRVEAQHTLEVLRE